jgi:hypothetical protein
MQTNNDGYNSRDGRDNQNDRNQNTGNLGGRENEPQKMGNLESENELRDMGRRPNDSWERDNRPESEKDLDDRDSRDMTSRTFNEDEATWEEEKRTGARTTNDGTRNDNWNANDPMQRSPGRYEEDDLDQRAHGRYNDEEQNRFARDNDRRHNEELEE